MPEKMWAITTILFLHDLFTVVWVGGMIALGLGVIPTLRRALGVGPQMQRLVAAFQDRYRWFAYVCIAGLVITGILQSQRSSEFQSFFAWSDTYSLLLSLKHVLIIIMVVIVIARSVFLGPRVPSGAPAPAGAAARSGAPVPPQQPQAPGSRLSTQMRLSVLLLMINIALGVAVLFLSAATATFSGA